MKRKLFLGLLAAATVSFTACQKDQTLSEVTEDNTAIGFGTYVGRNPQTKASSTTLTELQTSDKGFGVFAYYTDDETYPSHNNNYGSDFMTDQQVKFESPSWKYTPVRYWPGGNISFFAYAPYTGDGIEVSGINKDNKSDPYITYTVNETVSKQVDLLFASAKDQDGSTTGAKVDLTFNHALSKIGFKVEVEDGFTIDINSISLEGKFYKKGNFNLNDNPSDAINGWSNLDVKKDANDNEMSTTYEVSLSNNTSITTGSYNITADNGYVMVIPTDKFETDDLTIKVNYDYVYAVGSSSKSDDSIDVTGSYDGKFEQGKAYTFVLKFSPLNPIIFDVVEVVTWTDESEIPVSVTTIP